MSARRAGTTQAPSTPADANSNRLQHVLRVGQARKAQLKSTGGLLYYGVAGSKATVVADLRKSVVSGDGTYFAPGPGPDLSTLRTAEFAKVFQDIPGPELAKWLESVKENEDVKVETKAWLLDATDPKDVAFIESNWELLKRLRSDDQHEMQEARRAFVDGPFKEYLKTNYKVDSLMHDHGTWDEPSRVWSVGLGGQKTIRKTVRGEFNELASLFEYVIDKKEE